MKTKSEIVQDINSRYNNSDYVIIIDYKGLNASDTSNFRGELKNKCNTGFYVVKNTLNHIGSNGTDYENKFSFKGQCGVIFCNDLLLVSKVVNKLCFVDKKAKFLACFNRSEECTEQQFREIATLPSMEELRTKLLYVMNSVGSSLVRAMAERVKKSGENVD